MKKIKYILIFSVAFLFSIICIINIFNTEVQAFDIEVQKFNNFSSNEILKADTIKGFNTLIIEVISQENISPEIDYIKLENQDTFKLINSNIEFINDSLSQENKDKIIKREKNVFISTTFTFQEVFNKISIFFKDNNKQYDIKLHLIIDTMSQKGYVGQEVDTNYYYHNVNIISRKGWGCHTYGDGADPDSPYYCDGPFWKPYYRPTTHIVVHHTATSNNSSDWAATVRAIWYNHSHIRDADPNDGVQGWTDIGYNYLIDPNGKIYEGRYGSRSAPNKYSVKAGHVLGNNSGTIGIGLLGNYTDQNITSKAKSSLEGLIQVILDENGLDPWQVKVSEAGTSNQVVTGHKDWAATACPGNTFYPTIKSLNIKVGSLINYLSVYRFWSPKNETHFYTASYKERNQVISNYDNFVWTYEGVAFKIITDDNDITSAVYRFWSDKNQSHFYTMNEKEKNNVINNYPDNVWRYEGIAYYAYKTSYGGKYKPVYRFWSNKNQAHFYTANETEKNIVINNYDDNTWKYEGIAYYVSR